MHRVKHGRYAPYAAELEQANVRYEPMVWSAFGRPHPKTVSIMQTLAKKASRRRGLTSPQILLRRANAKIATEIWRRAARMLMACLPRGGEEEQEAEVVDLGRSEPPDIDMRQVDVPGQ